MLTGRGVELQALVDRFGAARAGRGGVVFVAGEAGVGKTTLVRAFAAGARASGALVLTGRCLSDSLAPFLPFMEAFRQTGLERIFTEEGPPRVESVYCATNTGLLVSHAERKGSSLDPNIFASMMSVIEDFVERSIGLLTAGSARKGVLSMSHGDYRILVQHGPTVNVAAIIQGRETEFLIEDLGRAVQEIEREFDGVLVHWDGDLEPVKGLEEILNSQFFAGQYDGVDRAEGHPPLRRSRIFEEATLALSRLAATSPVILWIEDVHAADPSTLALLHYAARGSATSPVLFVCTYRPEELGGSQAKALADLASQMRAESLLDVIELPRLDNAGSAAIVQSMLGARAPSNLPATIHAETGGNPLFVVETIRLLLAEGILTRVPDGWEYDASVPHPIPTRVYDVLTRRVARLSESERRLLDYCAVMGEEFEPDVVASALGLDGPHILEALRKLEGTDRLVLPVDGRFRFDHAKIREVVYDAIPIDLRRAYHGLIARSLEERYAQDIARVRDSLAFHYSRAGHAKKGVAYLTMAAQDALAKYANAEALRYADEALALMESQRTDKTKLEVLKLKAELQKVVGEWDACKETAQRLLAGGEETGEPEFAAAAHRYLGAIAWRKADWQGAVSSAQKAYDIARAVSLGQLEADALLDQGYAYERMGKYDAAEGCFKGVLARSLQLGDAELVAKAYRGSGILAGVRGRMEEATAYLEKALATWEASGNLRDAAKACNDLGNMAHQSLDFPKSVEWNLRCVDLARKVGDIRAVGYGSVSAGSSMAQLGDLSGAATYIENALSVFKRVGETMMIAAAYREMGIVRSLEKRYDAAIEDFQRALAFYGKDVKSPRYEAYTLRKLGEVHLSAGDPGAARPALQKALGILEALGLDTDIREVKVELAKCDGAQPVRDGTPR